MSAIILVAINAAGVGYHIFDLPFQAIALALKVRKYPHITVSSWLCFDDCSVPLVDRYF